MFHWCWDKRENKYSTGTVNNMDDLLCNMDLIMTKFYDKSSLLYLKEIEKTKHSLD